MTTPAPFQQAPTPFEQGLLDTLDAALEDMMKQWGEEWARILIMSALDNAIDNERADQAEAREAERQDDCAYQFARCESGAIRGDTLAERLASVGATPAETDELRGQGLCPFCGSGEHE